MTPDSEAGPVSREDALTHLIQRIERHVDFECGRDGRYAFMEDVRLIAGDLLATPSQPVPSGLDWQAIIEAAPTEDDARAVYRLIGAEWFESALPATTAPAQPVPSGLDALLAALEGDLEPKGTEQPDYLFGKQAGIRLAIGRVRALAATTAPPAEEGLRERITALVEAYSDDDAADWHEQVPHLNRTAVVSDLLAALGEFNR